MYHVAESLNSTRSNTVNIYVENHFDNRFFYDQVNIVDQMAYTIAHEGGHSMGLVHVADDPSRDIMSNGGPEGVSFNKSRPALEMGLDLSPKSRWVDVLNYLKDYVKLIPSEFNPLRHTFGFGNMVPPQGIDQWFDFFPLFGNGTPENIISSNHIDLGAIEKGSDSTLDLFIRNFGDKEFDVTNIKVGSTLRVIGDASGIVLPGNVKQVSIDLSGLPIGPQAEKISVRFGNGQESSILVGASVRSPQPYLDISLNNNLGGALVGQSVTQSDAVVLHNYGSSPLLVTGIRLVDGQQSFKVNGLPPDLSQQPITIAPGDSHNLSVTYTASNPWLERGTIEIDTNDPINPSMRVGVVGTGALPNSVGRWGNNNVVIEFPDLGDARTMRVKSDANGNFSAFLPASARYRISVFDPSSGLIAQGQGVTSVSGRSTDLTSTLTFKPSTAPDTDFDGLPDDIELAVGTASNKADTDKDGLSDFIEIQQGLDPLVAIQIPTSIVSSVALTGTAQAVVVEGSTTDPSKVTAYVATGSNGLALVDVRQFTKPIVLSALDLAGNNTDVAVDPARNLAAVAGGAAGLHLVNVAEATSPTLIQTIALPDGANRVEILDGFAYVASGSKLVSIDIATGEIRQQLDLHGGTLTDIAVDGSTLYTMDNAHTLRAVTVSALRMTARGTLDMSVGGGQLFVGNGIAYVAAEASSQGGFATANVADQDNLALLSGVDDTTIAGTAIALNGSGLGVNVGSPGNAGNLIQVVDVANPAVTDALVVQYTLPADPFDVAIAAGLAFVADGTGGLLVVNYLPFDRAGQAPTVTITEEATDTNPVAPGIQVLEGRSFRVIANVSDDVQARNVELLVNNQVVTNDVSFPWDLVATAPAIAIGGMTLTVQVRATDTGGNVTLSAPLVFDVVPDTFPPVVVETSPIEAARPFFVKSFDIRFDEPIDRNVINLTGAQVTNLGADDQFGTADDTSASMGSFTLRDTDSFLSLFPAQAFAAGDYRLVLDPAIIADRAGNHLASPFTLNFTIRPASDVIAASGIPAISQAPSANPGQAIGIVVPWGPSAARMTFPTIDSSGNLSTVTVTASGVDASRNVAFFVVPDTAVTGDVTVFGGGVNNYTGLPNWNVTRGSVDLFGNGFNDFLPGNGLYLDLDGSTNAAARLESKATFDLTPGTYQLQFNIGGSQRGDSNTVTVSLGTAFSEAFTFTSATPRTTVTRTITVAAGQSAKLVFDHTGGDNSGLLLTSVKLTRNDTSAVLLDDNFELPFIDGTFPLQIVPVVSGVDVTSVASDGSTAQVTLTGRGFIEGQGSRYRLGTVELVDGNAFTGPDVSYYYEYPPGQYLYNSLVSLTVPLSDGAVGPITVQTAGGTSAPFTVGFTGVTATALSGTPVDTGQASANPGQAITLTGSGLTTATDVILTYRDINGTSQTALFNPSFAAADGTSATLVVPQYLNGVSTVRVVGATVLPTLQLVPTLSSVDVQSSNLVLYGAGFVEGASTYQVPGATVVDTQVTGGVDVYYNANFSAQNGSASFSTTVLPRQGLGSVTVTTAGGTSAPLALTVLRPGSETTTVGSLGDVAIDPTTGALWVIDATSPATISRVEPTTGQVQQTIALPTATFGSTYGYYAGLQVVPSAMTLGATPVSAGSLLLFNGYTSPDQVTALHPTTGAVLATRTLAQNYDLTAGLYDAASGHLFVTDQRGSANHIVELDPTTGAELASFLVPFPIYSYAGLALDPATGHLWLGSAAGGAQVVELTRTGTEVRRVELTSQGLHANEISGLAFAPDGALYIASTRGVVYRMTVPAAPASLAVGVETAAAAISMEPSLNLSQAFVQQAWLKDFLDGASGGDDPNADLAIALPVTATV